MEASSCFYGVKNLEYEGMKRKNYFQVNLLGYLPMTLASGHRVRTLTPSVELRHINALMCGDSSVKTGFQRLVTGLNFSDNVRMATCDFCPGGAMRPGSLWYAPRSRKVSADSIRCTGGLTCRA